jgi:tetratricopeptide (TPR) repeat protein
MRAAAQVAAPRLRSFPLTTGALAGGVAALLFWTLFFGGGSRDLSLSWLGTATVLAAGVGVAAALLGALPWPELDRFGFAFVGLTGLFVLWNAASITWSLDPDRSWAYTNRGLVYLAFACLGLFMGVVVPRAPRTVAAALALFLAGALGWALLGKVVPSLFPDGGRLARLRSPIGYWNALALLADIAVALGLWLAAQREHRPAVRIGGVLLLYAAVVSILLAYSRAGVLVAIAVVAAWLALRPERLESLVACGLAAGAGGAIAGWAVTRPGVAHDVQPYSTRVHDGAIFGVVFLVGAAIVLVTAASLLRADAESPLTPKQRGEYVRISLLGVAVLAALLFAGSTIKAGGPGAWLDARAHEFTSQSSVTEGPRRVKSFSSNHRWAWWKESWSSFLDRPLEGTGAGSFVLVHRPRRSTSLDVTTEPHNVPLQFLGETGLVGFLLFGGAALAAALGIRATLRRLAEDDRPAALALALGALAYLLWSIVDFDWDYVAVTGPALFVVGVLLASGRRGRRSFERRTLWAGGSVLVALAAALSLLSPWFSQRQLEASLTHYQRGQLGSALAAAREAHSYDPLALEPLLVWAEIAGSTGDLPEAKRLYRRAVRLQPKNAEAWFEFGLFELEVDCFPLRAYQYLNRSYTLDPFGPTSGKGGPLDQARRLVNKEAGKSSPGRCG